MKKMININIVCSYASIYGGNFIPSILFLANSIKEKGNEIIFTFPNGAKNRKWAEYIQNQGYKICYISFGRGFSKHIKTVNRENGVDVMYAHFLSGLKIKLLYPFSKKIRLLIHIHSDFSAGKNNGPIAKIKRFIEYKLLRKDAIYFYVSREMSEKHKAFNKSIYLPNALCVERIPCEKFDVISFKNQFKITDKDTIFLHFGWSPYVKGTDIAVKAFLNSKYKISKSKLIIVHGREGGYDDCLKYLKEQNLNDIDPNQIVFIPPVEDVFSLYDLADVFISSSRSEGFSYSILESLYFNLKVLSSDIPGVQWAKKYNVEFFNNIEGLIRAINNSLSFKKKICFNNRLADNFNINEWCSTILRYMDV